MEQKRKKKYAHTYDTQIFSIHHRLAIESSRTILCVVLFYYYYCCYHFFFILLFYLFVHILTFKCARIVIIDFCITSKHIYIMKMKYNHNELELKKNKK